MHIDDYDFSESTFTTFLGIFDGSADGPKLVGYKDIVKGKTYESSDNKANILFWSRDAPNKRGFKLTYTSDKPSCT